MLLGRYGIATANKAPPSVGAPVHCAFASYKETISPEADSRATVSGTVIEKLLKALIETNSPLSNTALEFASNHNDSPVRSAPEIFPSETSTPGLAYNSAKSVYKLLRVSVVPFATPGFTKKAYPVLSMGLPLNQYVGDSAPFNKASNSNAAPVIAEDAMGVPPRLSTRGSDESMYPLSTANETLNDRLADCAVEPPIGSLIKA